jgi:hypothetical protein
MMNSRVSSVLSDYSHYCLITVFSKLLNVICIMHAIYCIFFMKQQSENSLTASWFKYYPQDGLRNKSAGNSIFLIFKVKLHKFVYPSSPTIEVHVIHPNCSQIPFLLHQSCVYILYDLDVRIFNKSIHTLRRYNITL